MMDLDELGYILYMSELEGCGNGVESGIDRNQFPPVSTPAAESEIE